MAESSLTKNQLTLALVRCGLVDPRAVDDPEDYDACETVTRISELYASLQLFGRPAAEPTCRHCDAKWIDGTIIQHKRGCPDWPKDYGEMTAVNRNGNT